MFHIGWEADLLALAKALAYSLFGRPPKRQNAMGVHQVWDRFVLLYAVPGCDGAHANSCGWANKYAAY